MGGFIAKQPNGLYCRFSTVVDTITHMNMTEEDYINYCVERAKEQAEREAKDVPKHWVHSFDEVKNSFYPGNNTIEEFNEMLHEMGDEEGLGEERIKELDELLKER
jgi:hypothetical protein